MNAETEPVVETAVETKSRRKTWRDNFVPVPSVIGTHKQTPERHAEREAAVKERHAKRRTKQRREATQAFLKRRRQDEKKDPVAKMIRLDNARVISVRGRNTIDAKQGGPAKRALKAAALEHEIEAASLALEAVAAAALEQQKETEATS